VGSFADNLKQFFYDPDEQVGELLRLGQDDAGTTAEASQERAHEYLAFFLEKECYAIPIHAVREIIRLVELTEIPRAPQNLLGVIKRHAEVLPVYDLKVRLKLSDRAPRLCGPDHELGVLSSFARIIIIQEPEGDVGILADRVLGVVRFAPSAIEPLPQGIGGDHLLGLGHSGRDLFILLDIHRVFS
jgi:purine-binding chemotaxis protein CheW